jgi:hypothetical protein
MLRMRRQYVFQGAELALRPENYTPLYSNVIFEVFAFTSLKASARLVLAYFFQVAF